MVMSSIFRIIRSSRRHAAVAVILLAVTVPAAALAATGSKPRELVPPKTISPANGARIHAGKHINFKIRSYAGDHYLWVHISQSPKRNKCGVIGNDVHIYSVRPTKNRSIYTTNTTLYHFDGFWMVTPGTYYWQVYRIEYHYNADGCIESPVRKLVITR
jgi:hypothetical protein